jgi:septum formation protein
MKPIVLASRSPRRRELLRLLEIPFESITTDSDETPIEGEPPAEMVERLSRLKAHSAQREHPDALIIAADTDVEFDGKILGKPADAAEALAMLNALRSRTHNVYTGITIADGAAHETELVHSNVLMRNYTDAERDAYIASGDPFDKAAGYNVQHRGFQPVARIRGCYANVMGLPLCRLYHTLARHIPMPAPQLACINHPEHDCSVESLVRENKFESSKA